VSHDVTTPLSGTVCRPSVGTSYGQPVAYTKYEVSMFTHYEDDEKSPFDQNAIFKIAIF